MLPHKTTLQTKYNKRKSFREQVKQTQTKYKELLQRAIYSDLECISKKIVIQAGRDQQKHSLFFVFGQEQPTSKRQVEKLYLYLVNYFDQKISNEQNQPFSIVYFNTCCESYGNYSTFRTIYRTLPLKYFQNLKRFIIVDPSFTVKAIEWFVSGTINKLLHNLTVYVDKLKELKEYGIHFTKHMLAQLPEYLAEEKSKQIARLSIRQSMQIRISKKVPEKNKKSKKLKLEDYEANELGIPIALHLMISYFLMRRQKLKQEGLFRKSVVKSQIDDAMEFIKQKYYDFLQQTTNPHIVANLITRFIGDLEQPLIPVSIYQNLVHDNGKGTQVYYLKQCFESLPRRNKVILVYFFDFLIKQVISLQQFNKMTTYNMAVVLTPCILKSCKELSIQELMYSKKLVIIVQFILNNYQAIFGDHESRKLIYKQSVRMEKQKFLKQNLQGCPKEDKYSQSSDNQQQTNYNNIITKQQLQETLEGKIGQKTQKFAQFQEEPISEEEAINSHSCFPVKVISYPDQQE